MWHHGISDDWIPVAVLLNVLETGAAKLGDQRFGITVSENNPMRFGAIGRAITRSMSLYSGLRASARLINKINSSAKIWIVDGPNTVWFCRSRTSCFLMEQFTLGHMIGLVQMAAGSEWKPRNIHLSAENDHGLNQIEVFDDAEFRTGQSCLAVAIPKTLLSDRIYPWPEDDERSQPENEDRMNTPPDDLVGSLRSIVESAVIDRYPTIDEICEIACLPKRTLQRELAKEGLTYREIVGQVRYRIACGLLTRTDATIREIASTLSYSRDVHFIRAFRHWAGVTPGEYRHHRVLRSSSLN